MEKSKIDFSACASVLACARNIERARERERERERRRGRARENRIDGDAETIDISYHQFETNQNIK